MGTVVGVDDRQCDSNPLAVEKEEQLVVKYRPAQAAAEMVHVRARFVVARCGIREIVRRIQDRAVPEFVQVSVKLVRARFGDVVNLRRAVPALIDRIGQSVDGHFGN